MVEILEVLGFFILLPILILCVVFLFLLFGVIGIVLLASIPPLVWVFLAG